VKNPIEITSFMIFSIGFFVIGSLNLFHINTFQNESIAFINFLNESNALGACFVVGVVVSIIRNYRRAKETNPNAVFWRAIPLFGFDISYMLLGVFASQIVFLVFTFSTSGIWQWIAGFYGVAAIALNLSRTAILRNLARHIR